MKNYEIFKSKKMSKVDKIVVKQRIKEIDKKYTENLTIKEHLVLIEQLICAFIDENKKNEQH